MHIAVILFFIMIFVALIKKEGVILDLIILAVDWTILSLTRKQADFEMYRYYYVNASVFQRKVNVEKGYQFLCVLFRDIVGVKFEVFWAIMSAISLLLLYKTVRRYTRNSAAVLALFSMFPLLISVAQFRMWLAFSIVLFGIRFLEENKLLDYMKLLICILVATSIHSGSIFFLILLLCIIRNEKKLLLYAVFWDISFSAVGMVIIPKIPILSNIFSAYTSHYTVTSKLESQMLFLFIIVLFYGFTVFCRQYAKTNIDIQGGKKIQAYMTLAVKINICALFLCPFAILSMETARFLRFFAIVTYIQFAIALSYKHKNALMTLTRVAIPMMSMTLMYAFSVQRRLMDTVIYPILHENIIIKLLN